MDNDIEKMSRAELEDVAVNEGLSDAKRFRNKPAVLDAIKRVRAGEDAATVNDELRPQEAETEVDAENLRNTEEADKEQAKSIHAINQGHPRQFDEVGNPVYNREDV